MSPPRPQSAARRLPPKITPEQAVADLVWAINSSWLVSGPVNWQPDQLPSITPEEIDSEHLAAHIDRNASWRVGRYFETLFSYYLHHFAEVSVIGEGIQVRGPDRQTRGELDFVIRSDCGSLTHWETAIKFYLCRPDALHRGSHYPGPDPQDTLESKLHRLTTHQLTLDWEHQDQHRDAESPQLRQAVVKGRIFYPAGYESPQKPPLFGGRSQPVTEDMPDGFRIHHDHCMGTWLTCREAAARLTREESAHEYVVMAKPNWLSPSVAASGISPAAAATGIRESFADSRSPVMLTEINLAIPERRRQIIVVNDDWPGPDPGDASWM